MPRAKDPNVAARKLTAQVATLKKQLTAAKVQVKQSRAAVATQIAALQKKHAEEIEAAAQTGYELACIEAEEKECQRATVVADALANFEASYAKKSKTKTAPKQATKAKGKRRGRPAKKKAATTAVAKRRGRPAKKAKKVKKRADAAPVQQPVVESAEPAVA